MVSTTLYTNKEVMCERMGVGRHDEPFGGCKVAVDGQLEPISKRAGASW